MGNIVECLNNIKNAVFGKDVRNSIYNGIKQCYDDAIANGHTDMEVAQARNMYKNLNERLNAENADLKNQVKGLASGSPLVAGSISEMIDKNRVYVNTSDGHWYYYNGSNWSDGGVYQATEIIDESVTESKISFADKLFNITVQYTDVVQNIELHNSKLAYLNNDLSILKTDIESGLSVYGLYFCNAGDKLKITYNYGNNRNQLGYAFTDNNNNVISYFFDSNCSGWGNKEDDEVIVPPLATRLYINRLVAKGVPAVKKVAETKTYIFKNFMVDGEGNNNNLYGKKILAFGDSMVEGHTLSKEQTWLHKLANRNSMQYTNKGQNGTTLTYVDTTQNGSNFFAESSVYKKVMDNVDNPVEADYIIVFAGTNDIARNVELGTINDDKATSFYGALNRICNRLIQTYYNKNICFFTPYARNAGTNFETCKQYVTAIEQVCEKYSIPVFNNIKNGGICWSNSYQLNALTLNDSYHLNETGQEYASFKYESFLKML